MTTVEIYKHARENLARIAHEQGVQLAANLNTSSEVNYRCRLLATEAKIDFLDKLLAIWEVNYDG